jgi:hypothetical protein
MLNNERKEMKNSKNEKVEIVDNWISILEKRGMSS